MTNLASELYHRRMAEVHADISMSDVDLRTKNARSRMIEDRTEVVGVSVGEYPRDYLRKHLEKKVFGSYHSVPPEGFVSDEGLGKVVEDITIKNIRDAQNLNMYEVIHKILVGMGLHSRDRKAEPNQRGVLGYKRDFREQSPDINVICSFNPKLAYCRISVWDREVR